MTDFTSSFEERAKHAGSSAPYRGSPEVGDVPMTIGQYTVESHIGSGGMGKVYKARDHKGNEFAIKVCLDPNPDRLQRFRREADKMQRLEHPHIVQAIEFVERQYLVMEYIEGQTLFERVKKGALEQTKVAQIMRCIANAVAYLHNNGVIHRDIKPQNVLLGPDDVPKLADLGLAFNLQEDQTLTRPGDVIGTLPYQSPEQLRGDGRSESFDIYALGALMFFALTGEEPFTGSESHIRRQIHSTHEPQLLDPDINTDLKTICLKCLEKQPRRRYATANALEDDLNRFLDGRPIAARPPGWLRRRLRRVRNKATQITTMAIALSLLSIAACVASFQTLFERPLSHLPISEWHQISTLLRDLDSMPADTHRRYEGLRKRYPLIHSEYVAQPNHVALARVCARYAHELALCEGELGLIAQSVEHFSVARRIFRELNCTLAQGQSAVAHADLLRKSGQVTEAERLYRQVFDMNSGPPDEEWHHVLGKAHVGLAEIYSERREFARALDECALAMQLLERITMADDSPQEHYHDFANCLSVTGTAHAEQGQLQLAAECLQRAKKILEENGLSHSGQRRLFRHTYGNTCQNLAVVFMRQGKFHDAAVVFHSAIDRCQSLRTQFPFARQYGIDLARMRFNLGECLRRDGELQSAENQFEALVHEYGDDESALPESLALAIIGSHRGLALINEEHGKLNTSLEYYDTAIGRLSPFAPTLGPSGATHLWRLSMLERARIRAQLGHHDIAVAGAEQVVQHPTVQSFDFYQAACVYSLSYAVVSRNDQAVLLRYSNRALALLKSARDTGYFADPATRSREHMKGDTDLDPIRHLDGFREFELSLDVIQTERAH